MVSVCFCFCFFWLNGVSVPFFVSSKYDQISFFFPDAEYHVCTVKVQNFNNTRKCKSSEAYVISDAVCCTCMCAFTIG